VKSSEFPAVSLSPVKPQAMHTGVKAPAFKAPAVNTQAESPEIKIYAVYGGQTSDTYIINGPKRDKKDGTLNPNFRI
jgi:hypothetical protein